MRSIAALFRFAMFVLVLGYLESQMSMLIAKNSLLAGEQFSIWIRAAYWGIPVLLLLSSVYRRLRQIQPVFTSFSRTYVFGFFLGHFMVLPLLVIRSGLQYFDWVPAGLMFGLELSIIIISLFVLILLVGGMIRNRYNYKVHRINIPIKDLPEGLEGFKLIQISDIHSGSFSSDNEIQQGIDLINQEEADLVCFTGDLVNSKATEIEPYMNLFGQIKSKHGVYSILGNHDYGDYTMWATREAKEANFQRLIQNHEKMGWQLLRNEHRKIEVEDTSLTIIGVENYSASGRFHKYGDLDRAIENMEPGNVQVLLSHDPSHWEDQVIQRFDHIDLTLSGHTHGFQFGFEFSKRIRWSPARWAYRQWAGLYEQGNQKLYVNRGFGFLGYHGRVGILPEITVLEFSTSK